MNRGRKIIGTVANTTGNEQRKQDSRDGSEHDRTDLERERSLIGRAPHPSDVERSPTEAYTMKSTSSWMESTYYAVPITTSPSWEALPIATLTMQSDPSHRE
jgi:hypothetical protein